MNNIYIVRCILYVSMVYIMLLLVKHIQMENRTNVLGRSLVFCTISSYTIILNCVFHIMPQKRQLGRKITEEKKVIDKISTDYILFFFFFREHAPKKNSKEKPTSSHSTQKSPSMTNLFFFHFLLLLFQNTCRFVRSQKKNIQKNCKTRKMSRTNH